MPPDPFGDAGRGVNCLRRSQGQVIRTDGSSLGDCEYYYERTPVGVYLRTKSTVSFVMSAFRTDSVTPDSLYRIDLKLGSKEISPVDLGAAAGGLSNYYWGSITAEGVKAYERAIYREAWDSTDVHFYYGSSGPRMAIVMRPGADPADVKLAFNGQDSINIDWEGALKIYTGGRYVKLSQAIAYQVTPSGTIVPVNWMPGYVHENGNVTVGFEYESYNPSWPLVFLAGYPPNSGGGGNLGNLVWSSYSGGQGGDELECVEVDESGVPYACGYATGTYFPIEVGYTVMPAFNGMGAGFWSAVIMKISPSDKVALWATYYGGNWQTKAHKLALDRTPETIVEHMFVTGSAYASNFPAFADDATVFANAFVEGYLGGKTRAWIGAFEKKYWGSPLGDNARPNRCCNLGRARPCYRR